MSAFDALSVRDLVALVVIATRTLREGVAGERELVEEAFKVADEFVASSEGKWATGARANHVEAEKEGRTKR